MAAHARTLEVSAKAFCRPNLKPTGIDHAFEPVGKKKVAVLVYTTQVA